MPHLPGCGCPGPAEGPCPLDPTPADQQTEMSTADLVRAALEGRPVDQQTEPTSTVALNDDTTLKAAIIAALSGTNQQ